MLRLKSVRVGHEAPRTAAGESADTLSRPDR